MFMLGFNYISLGLKVLFLVLGMVISDVEFETKEHEISTMDRIEPQQSNTFVHTAGTCIPLCTNLYVVVQFFPWFKLSFPCFKLIIHYHSLKKYRP